VTNAPVGQPRRPASSLDALRASGARVLEIESGSVLVATVVLALVIGALHPEFFSWTQMKDVLAQSVYVGILAAGVAFLISMRELDLSVGSVFGLSLIAAALLMRDGMEPWLAAGAGVLLGGAMGLFNAMVVQAVAIPAIVATLATLSMFRGLALALSDGQQVTGLPTGSSFFRVLGGEALGLPVSVWVLVAVGGVLTAVLRLTPFGYRVRSIGSNPEAAAFAGISIPRVRVQALALMGLLGGVSGMIGLAFFESGDPTGAPSSSCRRSPRRSSAARRCAAARCSRRWTRARPDAPATDCAQVWNLSTTADAVARILRGWLSAERTVLRGALAP
jgi:ribose transport system permease protein